MITQEARSEVHRIAVHLIGQQIGLIPGARCFLRACVQSFSLCGRFFLLGSYHEVCQSLSCLTRGCLPWEEHTLRQYPQHPISTGTLPRDAGHSAAGIEAAKTYDSEAFRNADPKVQEDMFLYNALRQREFSEDEALEATLNAVDG